MRPDYECEHGRLKTQCEKCAILALTAECDRLRAELAAANRRAQYWKDEHLACNTEIATLKALLRNVVARYDDYRGRGVSPAPNEYERVVDAIERIRAALGDEPASPRSYDQP